MNRRVVVLCAVFAVAQQATAQDDGAAKADRLELRATLESLRATAVINETEGRSTIKSLVREGRSVKKGDLICSLNVTDLNQRVAALQQELLRTRADADRLQASVAAARLKSEGSRSAASHRLKLAKLALSAWKEAEFPLEQTELEGAIRIAEVQLEYSRSLLKSSGDESETETLRVKLEVTKAEVGLASAKLRLKHFREYVHPARLIELEAEVDQAARHAEQTRSDAEEAALMAALEATTQQLKILEEQLKRSTDQQRAADIRAPHDGVVVYANRTARRTFSGALQVGQEVRERQTIAHVHDLSRLRAVFRADAAAAKKLKPGIRVAVQVDAFPNRSFEGTLTAVVDRNDAPEDGLESWVVLDPIEDDGPVLRPGMTAVVVIGGNLK